MGNFTLFDSFEREIGFDCLASSIFLTRRAAISTVLEKGGAGEER